MMPEEVPFSFQYSVYHTSKKPNTLSGDCYFAQEYEEHVLLSIADGLGSGMEARFAAEKAVKEIEKNAHCNNPLQLLKESNRTLHGSRGSVVGIAIIDWKHRKIDYAGVGNISCLIITPEKKKHYFISNPGFLNGRKFHAVERSLPFSRGDTIILFSDGIQLPDNWEYIVAGSLSTDIIMKRIVNEMIHVNDDATLIIGKWIHT